MPCHHADRAPRFSRYSVVLYNRSNTRFEERMATPTERQRRWYGTPYTPSPEQARQDIEDFLRWRGIEPVVVDHESTSLDPA